MTSVAPQVKVCPECRVALEQSLKAGLSTWECPNAHGVGISILEAYGHLQRDELEAIWAGAKHAPPSKLLSPITGRPMVEVTFTVDDDDRYGNDGVNTQRMVIELDRDNYFGWFSFEELRAMPVDVTKRGPARAGLVGLSQMDEQAAEFSGIFDDLDTTEYEQEDDRGWSRLFGSVGRKLHF